MNSSENSLDLLPARQIYHIETGNRRQISKEEICSDMCVEIHTKCTIWETIAAFW